MSDEIVTTEPTPVPVTGKVQVGEETITIARFRGLKAILAGALIKRVMEKVPDIRAAGDEFTKKYRQTTTLTITKENFRSPGFRDWGYTEEDFKDGPVEVPLNPSGQQVFMAIFPDLWDLAKEEVTNFFGLLAISNKDLEEADDADKVDEALARTGKKLIREGYIEELAEVCLVGWEVLQDQILKKRDRLGKIMDLPFLQDMLSTPQREEGTTDSSVTPATSQPDAQTSSTDSDGSTDGIDAPPSTESPGTSSSSFWSSSSNESQQNGKPKNPAMAETPQDPSLTT